MLKVSSDRLVKPRIEHATPELQGKRVIYYTMGALSCHARIQEFSSGGPRSIWHKKLRQRYFFVFLVLNLFYRSKMVILFSNVPEGVQHFFQKGIPTFSRGAGSNCLFHIETHISCDIPGCPNPLSTLLWIRPCFRSCTSILRFTDLHIGSRS